MGSLHISPFFQFHRKSMCFSKIWGSLYRYKTSLQRLLSNILLKAILFQYNNISLHNLDKKFWPMMIRRYFSNKIRDAVDNYYYHNPDTLMCWGSTCTSKIGEEWASSATEYHEKFEFWRGWYAPARFGLVQGTRHTLVWRQWESESKDMDFFIQSVWQYLYRWCSSWRPAKNRWQRCSSFYWLGRCCHPSVLSWLSDRERHHRPCPGRCHRQGTGESQTVNQLIQ